MQRAQGIAVTCPDPMILARGLSVIVAGVLQKNADAAFRTSLVKNALMVDTSPTLATVTQYQQHLKGDGDAGGCDGDGKQSWCRAQGQAYAG